jgi:hypothetical protein
VAQHPSECRPQQRRYEDRNQERDDQTPTPIAAATTRKRHEYAVATRSPRGTESVMSVETTRLRSRRASNSEPRGLSSEPLIPQV